MKSISLCSNIGMKEQENIKDQLFCQVWNYILKVGPYIDQISKKTFNDEKL
jgi:hypothetical protein